VADVCFNFSYSQLGDFSANFRWRRFAADAQMAAYYETTVIRSLIVSFIKRPVTITRLDAVITGISDGLTVGQAVKYADKAI